MVELLSYLEKSDKLGHDDVGRPFIDGVMGNKIGTYKGHDIYHRIYHNVSSYDGQTSFNRHYFSVVNPKTETVTMQLKTKVKPLYRDTKNKVHEEVPHNTHEIETVYGDKSELKAHDLYHYLLKKGHVTTFKTTSQSYGGQRIWQKLANKHNISIYGLNGNKRINLDPKNPDETHDDPDLDKRYKEDYFKSKYQHPDLPELPLDKTEDEKTRTPLYATYIKNLRARRSQLTEAVLYHEPKSIKLRKKLKSVTR